MHTYSLLLLLLYLYSYSTPCIHNAVSSIIGNRLAWLVGLDEKHLSSYSAGSFVVIALYILVNGLVLFGNGMHEGYWVRSSGEEKEKFLYLFISISLYLYIVVISVNLEWCIRQLCSSCIISYIITSFASHRHMAIILMQHSPSNIHPLTSASPPLLCRQSCHHEYVARPLTYS